MVAQLAKQMRADLLLTDSVATQLTRQMRANLSLTDSAVAKASKISEQMKANLSLTDSAATQLAKQMRASLSLTDSAATQLAKQMRIDLLPNRAKIPEELLLTAEHFSQDAVVMIDGEAADNVDESDSKLINESLNPDNNNLPKYS
ncbi:MAG: hypothetical protein ACYT04_70050, partial [Nostoc sp.]